MKQDRKKDFDGPPRMTETFIAQITHELRTPVASIIEYSELMLDELYGPLNEKQRGHIGSILASSRMLLTLINDIMDVSKIQAGMFEIDSKPFDIGHTFRDVKVIFKEGLKHKALTLTIDIPEDSPYIESDELRVKQVLVNIISNAMKFSHVGGHIDVRAWIEGDKMCISVKDEGIGMSKDEFAHLGEPFWQATNTGNRAWGGTGLGLCISQRIVEHLGSRIRFESEVGKGTTVSFTLPVYAR